MDLNKMSYPERFEAPGTNPSDDASDEKSLIPDKQERSGQKDTPGVTADGRSLASGFSGRGFKNYGSKHDTKGGLEDGSTVRLPSAALTEVGAANTGRSVAGAGESTGIQDFPAQRQVKGTALEGLQAAQELRECARRAKDQGRHGAAFDFTAQAWNCVRVFPDDAQCRLVTSELAQELESLAVRANSEVVHDLDGPRKRLVDR